MSDLLRILAVADIWQGSNAYAFVRAFRRMGHAVKVLPPENFLPGGWNRKPLRALRRLIEPLLVDEYRRALIDAARRLDPHLYFVFKGRFVHPDAVRSIQEMGAIAVNFYPDVSILAHGQYLPRALPLYDWVFTTKPFGIDDMRQHLGIESSSFVPHGYDPEVHAPRELDARDRATYECDVSFVGTWSPKKQAFLEVLASACPDLHIRVWGAQWEGARASLGDRVQGRGVHGIEYAKALIASRVNLAILSEVRTGASSGDTITSRTFHIPATGAFMLHERTAEFLEHFDEDEECGCFASPEEMAEKVRHFLEDEDHRVAAARAGFARCTTSGYSIDTRARTVLDKFEELRDARSREGQ